MPAHSVPWLSFLPSLSSPFVSFPLSRSLLFTLSFTLLSLFPALSSLSPLCGASLCTTRHTKLALFETQDRGEKGEETVLRSGNPLKPDENTKFNEELVGRFAKAMRGRGGDWKA